MKEKSIRSLALAVALLFAAVSGRAATEDRFDVFAKSIGPILALLTPPGSEGNHALNLQATVAEATGLPPQLLGAHVHFAFEFPDKLLVQFPTPNGEATLCRNGQSVWAYPAALFAPIVEKVGASVSTEPLTTFEIEAKKAVLLPALFDVHDAGTVKPGAAEFRVLDVGLILEQLKKKHSNAYPVRVWIDPGDHHIAQIAWRQKDWSVTLKIDQMEFAPSLPATTWNPTPRQHDQVMAVPGEKIDALLQLALRQKK